MVTWNELVLGNAVVTCLRGLTFRGEELEALKGEGEHWNLFHYYSYPVDTTVPRFEALATEKSGCNASHMWLGILRMKN